MTAEELKQHLEAKNMDIRELSKKCGLSRGAGMHWLIRGRVPNHRIDQVKMILAGKVAPRKKTILRKASMVEDIITSNLARETKLKILEKFI